MERKDFLKSTFAFGCLAMIPVGLIESCSKSSSSAPATVNFTLDLTQAANASLNTVGGAVIANNVIVIKYDANTYYAFSAICTHQGCTVAYNSSQFQFACPCHGGVFNATTGAVVSGPPPSALTKYTVAKNGNILTVT